MTDILPCERERGGILSRQHLNDITKEIFRKAIHMCSALVPLFLHFFYLPVIILLFLALCLYCLQEFLRRSGRPVPLFSAITAVAARKRDENKFVLGPVTLVLGILLCAIFYKPLAASVGIYALSFGDGMASLAGKLFGRIKVPFTLGKTAEGSLTCFTAIFVSAFLTCNNVKISLIIAGLGMFIEVLPLKDFDNLLIPLLLGGTASLLLP